MKDWLAFTRYAKKYDQLSASQKAHIDRVIQAMDKQINKPSKPQTT